MLVLGRLDLFEWYLLHILKSVSWSCREDNIMVDFYLAREFIANMSFRPSFSTFTLFCRNIDWNHSCSLNTRINKPNLLSLWITSHSLPPTSFVRSFGISSRCSCLQSKALRYGHPYGEVERLSETNFTFSVSTLYQNKTIPYDTYK